MAFEDSSQARGVGRHSGSGLSTGEYLPVRRETATFEVAPLHAALVPTTTTLSDSEPTIGLGERVPPPNLHYVFDDPAVGEPGRDRMMVHGLWELVLAVALAGAGYLLSRAQPGVFNGVGLRQLALATTVLGLVAAASALALRAGVPNLAVGPVAVVAALYVGQHAAGGVFGPAALVVGICAGIGLVQGMIVVGLQVPAWAASLGVTLAVLVWTTRQAATSMPGAGYNPTSDAYLWFGGFCALSLGASLLGLLPVIRRGFGRFRPVVDPARRRGLAAALIALGATVASMVLAGLGGVLAVFVERQVAPSDGLELTAIALGAALLGGTSAFGRRGGIFGTIFAAGLISVGLAYAEATDRTWPVAGFAAVAIAIGLGVTRLVERFGRPNLGPPSDEDDDWAPRVHSLAPAGRAWQPPQTPTGGLWAADDAWGTTSPR